MPDVKYGFTLRVTEETLREARIVQMRDELRVTYDTAARIIDAVDAYRPPAEPAASPI